MAKIPLRVYNREIEAMIDRGESNTAIAHCRHILKYYPKHIDTYRLLGKAYLESQRYAEAADILQRIISAVPDDFISQIGMSIIREDEGNLDAAIWHMERAFEAQPSNTAVQDELRRLYGRRDGVEPPKIRLTRGALVRMYARGELYQQAIAEIRAALAEDPLRVDLEVILARMYFLSEQNVAAIEVCSRLISKLPYCFEANRILAETLPNTSHAEDAKIYQQRVFAMDPYLAYLPAGALSSAEVPDNAVTLDRLEIETLEEETTLPEWAQTAGVEFEKEEEALPDWFSEIKPDTGREQISTPLSPEEGSVLFEEEQPSIRLEETPSPLISDTVEEAEETIPDWMKEAGWIPVEKVDETAEVGFNIPEEGLEFGEMPEWLQEIAPPESLAEEPGAGEEDIEWLEKILPSEEKTSVDQVQQVTPIAEEQIPEEFPFTQEDQILLEKEQEISIPPLGTDEEKLQEENPETEFFAQEPEWLKSLSEEETTPFTSHPSHKAEDQVTETQPSQETTGIGEEIAPDSTLPDMDDLDATMAWLESLAAKQGADEATLLTPPEERQETPPAWIQSLAEEQPQQPATEEIPQVISDEGLPEVLPVIEEEKVEISQGFLSAEVEASEKGEEVPSVEPELIKEPETVEETGSLPDWLLESLQEEEEQIPSAETTLEHVTENQPSDEIFEPPIMEEPIASPESSEQTMDEDAAFAWLESLAAKQGVSEETLLTKPEERQEELPDWIHEEQIFEEVNVPASDISPQTEEAVETYSELTEGSEPVEDTQPVHLKAATQSTREESIEIPGRSEEVPSTEKEEIPQWLQGLEELESDEEITEQTMSSEWVTEFVPPPQDEPAPQPQPEVSPLIEKGNYVELLQIAQSSMQAHNIEKALQAYNQLIKDGQFLEETIHDLREALYRYPIDVSIWQILGDAYLRSNRLQEALEAYTKAEELLR